MDAVSGKPPARPIDSVRQARVASFRGSSSSNTCRLHSGDTSRYFLPIPTLSFVGRSVGGGELGDSVKLLAGVFAVGPVGHQLQVLAKVIGGFVVLLALGEHDPEKEFEFGGVVLVIHANSLPRAFLGVLQILLVVVSQSIQKPGVGEIDGIKGEQLGADVDDFGPLPRDGGQLRQVAIGAGVLGIGGDGLLEGVARGVGVVLVLLDASQLKPGAGVLGIDVDRLGERLLGLIPMIFRFFLAAFLVGLAGGSGSGRGSRADGEAFDHANAVKDQPADVGTLSERELGAQGNAFGGESGQGGLKIAILQGAGTTGALVAPGSVGVGQSRGVGIGGPPNFETKVAVRVSVSLGVFLAAAEGLNGGGFGERGAVVENNLAAEKDVTGVVGRCTRRQRSGGKVAVGNFSCAFLGKRRQGQNNDQAGSKEKMLHGTPP